MQKNFFTLQELLHNYAPDNAQEEQYKEEILSFLQTNPNAFERSLPIGHITASCWLINKSNDKTLLTHHKKLNAWFQLGGHCDGDTNVLAVALKEAQEESGIQQIQPVDGTIFDIDIHLIPENKKEAAHYHYDIRFLLQVVDQQDFIISSESHELAWFDKNRENLPTNSISVVRMFNKWLSM